MLVKNQREMKLQDTHKVLDLKAVLMVRVQPVKGKGVP